MHANRKGDAYKHIPRTSTVAVLPQSFFKCSTFEE